jgi:prevent-host-death family protein
MNDIWQLQDAKAKLSEVVEKAMNGEPQFITKRGEPAVVVISQAEFLRQRQQSKSLSDALAGAPEELRIKRDKTPLRPNRLG